MHTSVLKGQKAYRVRKMHACWQVWYHMLPWYQMFAGIYSGSSDWTSTNSVLPSGHALVTNVLC